MGVLADQSYLITKMIRKWTEANGAGALSPELAHLALHVGIKVAQEQSPPGVSTPRLRRDKHDKVNTPLKTVPKPLEGALKSKRFVLTGTWPGLGRGLIGNDADMSVTCHPDTRCRSNSGQMGPCCRHKI
jgi:hypothetical protein